MPKNKGKGGKNRRRGRNKNENDKRELIFKEFGQEYAHITQILGNNRVKARCYDGKDRLCHIRGKMRKKEWVNVGDIVLVGLREFQDCKADVITRYYGEEVERLKELNEIPRSVETGITGEIKDDDILFANFDKDKSAVTKLEDLSESSSEESSNEEGDQGVDDGDNIFN